MLDPLSFASQCNQSFLLQCLSQCKVFFVDDTALFSVMQI